MVIKLNVKCWLNPYSNFILDDKYYAVVYMDNLLYELSDN